MIDAKFEDVRVGLARRGWSGDVSWRNLKATDFNEVRGLVNHLQGAQVLSHKATLARLLDVAWFPRCYDLRCLDHAREFVRDPAAVWVVKPAGGSCGVGVRCVKSLEAVIEYARSVEWKVVAQRYVERPLLIRSKKFDIRQWILITSLKPLVVYGFSACYSRFAANDWSLENLDDKFAHLCNYSIQQDSSVMWHSDDLAEYIGDWESVLKQLHDIALGVAKVGARAGVTKVAHGFEWLGLDVLLDSDYKAWLLEVNVSPDVSHSTRVTADLVTKATDDALTLLLDEHAADPSFIAAPRDHRPHPRWDLWSTGQDDDDSDDFPEPFSYVAPPPHVTDAAWDSLLASINFGGEQRPGDESDDEL